MSTLAASWLPIAQWLAPGVLEGSLRSRYDPRDVTDRVATYASALAAAASRGFDAAAPVALVASPGRDRLFMGHTDFPGLGGPTVNAATREEIVAVVQRIAEPVVRLRNADAAAFADADVALAPLASLALRPTWRPDDWSSYARGALAYLLGPQFPRSEHVRARVLGRGGLAVLIASAGALRLPTSGGLSSSAALTSALALCVNECYGLGLGLSELALVDFGEYYLGKKAGAADKAAQLFAVRGKVVVVGSYPEVALGTVAFPAGLRVLMAQTGIPRLSTADGLAYLAQRHPAPLPELAHAWARSTMQLSYVPGVEAIVRGLGDPQLCAACGLGAAESAAALRALAGNNNSQPLLRELCASGAIERELPQLAGPAGRRARHALAYRLLRLVPESKMADRQVCLFGLSEVERGAEYVRTLAAGDAARVLGLVARAHDGDRALVDYRRSFAPTEWAASPEVAVTDAALVRWAAEGAELESRTGAFQRSLPEIDEVATEVSQRFRGEAALRIAAAGMGGVVAIHVTAEAAARVKEWLESEKGFSVREVTPSSPCSFICPATADIHLH
eukprot:m51a1_g8696 hypothetical protein (564) ;mRNA; f:54762-56789